MKRNALVVFVDVDDTLVRSVGAKTFPIPATVRHVKQLAAEGAILYCWSSGGPEYARRTAETLEIADYFVGFLHKPNLIIDDQLVTEWRSLRERHPASIEGWSVDDYWAEIENSAQPDRS